ncbi:hypothetical protein OROHE_009825 [Orobanche hederae]
MSADVHPCSGSFTLIDLNAVDTLQIEVSGDPETVEKILGDRLSEISIKSSSDSNPQHAMGMMQDMHMGLEHTENLVQEDEDIAGRLEIVSGNKENDVTASGSVKSYSEMHETLELRLATVENEIRSAEQEKLEKEMAARKLLCAGINYGESGARVEDPETTSRRQCQGGEIAVICQDVKVLKEKLDEHVSLSKSLFSSQTSFILASSNSLESSSTDQVEPVPVGDDDDLLETQKKGDPKQISEEKADRDDRKAPVDDGWDFFDERENQGVMI